MQEDRPGTAQPQGASHSDDDTRGTQGKSKVGQEQGDAEHDAVLDMAPAIRYADRIYTPDECTRISTLRHERWLILARFANPITVKFHRTTEYKTLQERLNTITKELYQITNNPIYNAR
jgi:hypothetical protein